MYTTQRGPLPALDREQAQHSERSRMRKAMDSLWQCCNALLNLHAIHTPPAGALPSPPPFSAHGCGESATPIDINQQTHGLSYNSYEEENMQGRMGTYEQHALYDPMHTAIIFNGPFGHFS
jgi:hypothetical protein